MSQNAHLVKFTNRKKREEVASLEKLLSSEAHTVTETCALTENVGRWNLIIKTISLDDGLPPFCPPDRMDQEAGAP